MLPPKILRTMQHHVVKEPKHSSLLLWTLLIMVILSGLVYLGAKMQQLRTEKPTASANSQISTSPSEGLPQSDQPSVEKILDVLKSQQWINPVVYKTQMALNDDAVSGTTRTHDALWQKDQQQLTMVKATVYAGINLGELTPRDWSGKPSTTLYLPPARIRQIQIDQVTMYDVKTGQASTVQLGLSLTSDQEKVIRAQVEREFCQSDVLQTATEDTRQHVISMLDTMKISTVVRVAEPIGCQTTAS